MTTITHPENRLFLSILNPLTGPYMNCFRVAKERQKINRFFESRNLPSSRRFWSAGTGGGEADRLLPKSDSKPCQKTQCGIDSP
jgi:hypothetical protein